MPKKGILLFSTSCKFQLSCSNCRYLCSIVYQNIQTCAQCILISSGQLMYLLYKILLFCVENIQNLSQQLSLKNRIIAISHSYPTMIQNTAISPPSNCSLHCSTNLGPFPHLQPLVSTTTFSFLFPYLFQFLYLREHMWYLAYDFYFTQSDFPVVHLCLANDKISDIYDGIILHCMQLVYFPLSFFH